jgi:hypothetical protein
MYKDLCRSLGPGEKLNDKMTGPEALKWMLENPGGLLKNDKIPCEYYFYHGALKGIQRGPDIGSIDRQVEYLSRFEYTGLEECTTFYEVVNPQPLAY